MATRGFKSESWMWHLYHLQIGFKFWRNCEVCQLDCNWPICLKVEVRESIAEFRAAQKSGDKVQEI